jgi:hypothetical protein
MGERLKPLDAEELRIIGELEQRLEENCYR